MTSHSMKRTAWKVLSSLVQADRGFADIEEYKMFCFMRDESPEVTSDNAVPRRPVLLIKKCLHGENKNLIAVHIIKRNISNLDVL